jgi:hypothetical protein
VATWKELAFAEDVHVDRVNFRRWFSSDYIDSISSPSGMKQNTEYFLTDQNPTQISSTDASIDDSDDLSLVSGSGPDLTGTNDSARTIKFSNTIENDTDAFTFGKQFGSAMMTLPRPNPSFPKHYLNAHLTISLDATYTGSTATQNNRITFRLYREYVNLDTVSNIHWYRMVYEKTQISPPSTENFWMARALPNLKIPLDETKIDTAGDVCKYIASVEVTLDDYPTDDNSNVTVVGDFWFSMYASMDDGLGT